MKYVVETQGLTKYFGKKVALKQLNLKVQQGGILALLGRNGAGKSTLIRTLLGLDNPTRGSSKIFGLDSQYFPQKERSRIGYMTEEHQLYPWMTVDQCVSYQSHFFPKWNDALCNQTIEHFRMDRRNPIKKLSRGERAGLCLALVLAQQPELLILDDPSLGLDIVAQRAMLETLINISSNPECTVILSTHMVSEIERIADRIAIIREGQLEAHCPLEDFQDNLSLWSIKGTFHQEKLEKTSGILRIHPRENEVHVTMVGSKEETLEKLKAVEVSEVFPLTLSIEQALSDFLEKRNRT